MTAPVVLICYAVLVASLGGRWLSRASWTHRSPRLGIAAWQSVTVSVVLAVLSAGVALAVPTLPITTDLALLLHSCASVLKEHYSTPGGAAAAAVGVVLVVAVVSRTVYCVLASLSAAQRTARLQRQRLNVIAERDPTYGALVVENATPAVYCLPGSGSEVIFTTAALHTLTTDQIRAVLAHERAHLSWRHWLVVATARGLATAFPFVPVFSLARLQLALLVEMHADDAAVPATERRLLATALVTLAEGTAPAGTLAAGGQSALARVHRLARPAQPLGLVRSVLVATALLLSLVSPLAVLASPAAAAAVLDLCPLGFLN